MTQEQIIYKIVRRLYILMRNEVIVRMYTAFADKPVTQKGIAELFGVRQSAVSMMLKRSKEDHDKN